MFSHASKTLWNQMFWHDLDSLDRHSNCKNCVALNFKYLLKCIDIHLVDNLVRGRYSSRGASNTHWFYFLRSNPIDFPLSLLHSSLFPHTFIRPLFVSEVFSSKMHWNSNKIITNESTWSCLKRNGFVVRCIGSILERTRKQTTIQNETSWVYCFALLVTEINIYFRPYSFHSIETPAHCLNNTWMNCLLLYTDD